MADAEEKLDPLFVPALGISEEASPNSSLAISSEDSEEHTKSTDCNAEVESLRREVEILQDQLRQEKLAREVVSVASHKADISIAKMLSEAWRTAEVEKEAHRLSSEEKDKFMADCEQFRRLYEACETQRCEEMLRCREAIRAVEMCQRQVWKLKGDNEHILEQLVKTKLDYANKCMDYDELEKKYNDSLRLLLLAQDRIDILDKVVTSKNITIPINLSSTSSESAGFTDSSSV